MTGSNDPTSAAEAIAQAGLPRIHEYTADAHVAEKLNAAGYNPAAYQAVLTAFHDLEPKGGGVDFAHGNTKDRQSAQILQMKLRDYEATSQPDTQPKPLELTEQYLAPKYQPSLFDRLYNQSRRAPDEATRAELAKLSPDAILDFHATLCSRLVGEYEASGQRHRAAPLPDVIHCTALIGMVDQEVERRIGAAFPHLSAKEAYWAKLVLYTEVQDRKFGELQELADTIAKHSGPRLAATVDYAGKLIATLNSDGDVLAFARLAKDTAQFAQLGYTIYPTEFPRRMFSIFEGAWGTSKDQFFEETIQKLYRDPRRYQEQFGFINQVAAALAVEPGTVGGQWARVQLGAAKNRAEQNLLAQIERADPWLYDRDTPEAVSRYAPQVKPHLVALYQEYLAHTAQYLSPEDAAAIRDRELQMMAGRLYRGLPYVQRQEYAQQFLTEYKRAEDPLLDTLLHAIDRRDLTSAMGVIRDHGLQTFLAEARSAGLAERDIDFTHQLLGEVRQYLDTDHALTAADTHYLVDVMRGSRSLQTADIRAALEHLQSAELANLSADHVLAALGLQEREARLLLTIEVSRALTLGGSERRAFAEYERLVNSLDLTDVSSRTAMIIYHQLLSFGEAGGHGLAHYRERDWELNWGRILQAPNMLALRDAYFHAWEAEGVTLTQRITAVRTLSERLTEFANKTVREPSANWFGSNQEVALYLSPLVERVMTELAHLEVDQGSIDDLKMLHELTGVFEDRRLSSRLRAELETKIVRLMTFEQATAYLQELLDGGSFPVQAIDWYQEHHIQTPAQLERATALMNRYFDQIHDKGEARLTAAAGLDYVFENFLTKHSQEVFDAALESQHDDTKLRTLLARLWYDTYMRGGSAAPYQLKIPTDRNGLPEVTLEGGAQHKFVPFESFVDSFYAKLSQGEVDVLLRKMLISDEGVLMTPEGRDRLHHLLVSQIAQTPDDGGLRDLIDRVVSVGLNVVDPAKLYQPIAGILRARLFLAPTQPGSNDGAARYIHTEYAKRLRDALESSRDSVARAETTFRRQQAMAEYERYRQYITDNMPSLRDIERVLLFNPTGSTQSAIAGALQTMEDAKTRVTSLVGMPERQVEAQTMEPVQVVMEFSRNMGAVGVRFLQLLGQYVDVPDRYQAQFDEVYDQVRGQLKFTAYQTLQREATKPDATPELKAFWQNLQSLSPTVAGGSLMTVYRAQMKDGNQKIVKVLNPNAEEFVRQNIADTRAVIGALQARKRRPEQELAGALVNDLEEWLVEDITTTSYEANNAVFEQINNGVVVSTSGGRFVTIASPATTQTGTKYVKIEDVVEGKNLSEVLNQEGPEAARPYVEAAIKSVTHQAETPSADGVARVHSDVHIGNIRIGDDGKLYWIDRGYYLEMSSAEMAIIKPLLEGRFDPMAGMQAVGYLLDLPENRHLTQQMDPLTLMGQIAQSAITAKASGQSDLAVANSVLLSLKEQGFHIPIRFSLFFKNVRAEAKMAERVGLRYL